MAVQFRHNYTSYIDGFVEGRRLLVDRLALRRVQHENHIIRLDRDADLLHLLEEGRLLAMAARRVHNNHLVFLLAELRDAFRRDRDGIRLGIRPVEGTPELRGILFELVVGTGPKSVGADHAALKAFPLIVIRKLRNCGRLAGALESDEHDHVRLALLDLVGLHSRIDNIDQLIYYCSLYEFPSICPSNFLLQGGSRFYCFPQLAHHSYVNIGLEQRRSYIL